MRKYFARRPLQQRFVALAAAYAIALASLIAAIPRMEPEARLAPATLAGEPPSPQAEPAGCAFHPRCPSAMDQCRTGSAPAPRMVAGRLVRCHLYPEEG